MTSPLDGRDATSPLDGRDVTSRGQDATSPVTVMTMACRHKDRRRAVVQVKGPGEGPARGRACRCRAGLIGE